MKISYMKHYRKKMEKYVSSQWHVKKCKEEHRKKLIFKACKFGIQVNNSLNSSSSTPYGK